MKRALLAVAAAALVGGMGCEFSTAAGPANGGNVAGKGGPQGGPGHNEAGPVSKVDAGGKDVSDGYGRKVNR